MKIKFILLSLALACVSMTMSAQSTKEKYTSEGDRNIFISATGGISVLNTGELDGKFGNVAPHFTLSLGKWFNPVLGLRLQGAGFRANYDANFVKGNLVPSNLGGVGYKEQANEFKMHKTVGIVRLDALYNISNAIWGYNPSRVFNLIAFAGPGLTFGKDYENIKNGWDLETMTYAYTADKSKTHLFVNGSVGLLGKFNVSKYVDIDLEVRGELAPNYLGYTSIAKTVGGIYAGAGLTYTFGGKEFIPRQAKVDNSALNDEINRLRQELAQALADLNKCREDLAKKPKEVQVEKEVEVAAPRAIFFTIGSSKLDDYGKVNIQLAAKAMKANPDHKYKVSGYADKATGAASWNQKLTDKRAQVVYDALIAEGVSASQLEMVSNGGTENMFWANKLNRCVILE